MRILVSMKKEEKEKFERAYYSLVAKIILGGGFGILCGIVAIIFWSLAEHLN